MYVSFLPVMCTVVCCCSQAGKNPASPYQERRPRIALTSVQAGNSTANIRPVSASCPLLAYLYDERTRRYLRPTCLMHACMHACSGRKYGVDVGKSCPPLCMLTLSRVLLSWPLSASMWGIRNRAEYSRWCAIFNNLLYR